jgi:hypothetical protein
VNRFRKAGGPLAVLVAWACIALIVCFDGRVMHRYINLLDDSSTLPTDVLAHREIVPSDFADAYTWTRLAIRADDGGPWHIRHTDIDNAPVGRPVYWNSAFIHLIASAGRFRAWLFHEPTAVATERARIWFNAPLFLAVVIVFSVIIARCAGAALAAMTAFAMVGDRWFYDGFGSAYVDHHGLLTAATFGVPLGVAFMGAGWLVEGRPAGAILPTSFRAARASAIFSAACGAFGLWISAASVVPTIAFTGLGAVVAGMWLGPSAAQSGAVFEPRLWRIWGLTGCALSLLAYVAEFVPGGPGLRLEINNPLYALAWLGGAELVAMIVDRRVRATQINVARAVVACLLVALPLLVIAAFGSRVFAPIDPAVGAMHHSIKEFQSLASLARVFGIGMVVSFAIGFVLLLPGLILVHATRDRMIVAFAFVVAIMSVILACIQARWWLTASGPELVLLLAGAGIVLAGHRAHIRWVAAGVVGAIFAGLAIARIASLSSAVDDRIVSTADALEPMYRDAAVALRTDDPRGKIVLLANPNASTAIGYFGEFQTLASLYWENLDGIRAAADILAAASDSAAFELLKRRGVTHVAAITPDDYLASYLHIARPNASPSELRNTFGYRLLHGRDVPRWLRAIPFRPRFPETDPPGRALLFQLVPEQTADEALWAQAVAEIARGEQQNAFEDFARAVRRRSDNGRSEMYERASGAAYQWHDHRLALALLDSTNRLHATRTSAMSIAWILATSTDPQIRNGREALAIARQIGGENSNDVATLDVVAAAFAETGDLTDAVRTAGRMLALARAANDSAGAARATARMTKYSAGQPWRQ